MVVLATRCGGNIEPVSLEVSEGETGIPIFETVEDAKEFDQGYRKVLGPGLEARELPDQARAQLLLGKFAEKAEHVILKPRPVRASGESVGWEMVDIR